MAKKDPYKNIQKRFVQARAGDVEYEDLSVEQREQFQNRFNTLAQTVEGRTKIAQRLLPTANPEQRAQLKQRIRKNLPSGQEIEMPGDEPTPTRFERPAPTSANIRDMQAGFRMQGQAIEATRKAAVTPTSKVKETTTKSKVSSSDRIGSGFFSIPKNPLAAVKEFATGAKDLVTDTADYVNRGFVNPVINVAARGADIISGKPKDQRFKPLPQFTNKEIAIESALTLGTAGAGQLLRPLIRPTGAALSSVAKAVGGRSPGVGAALSNISQRQANLAAVREASALAQAGKQAVSERVAALGTDIRTGTTPKPSGAKFFTPKQGSSVTRPTAPKAVTPKAAKPKAVKPKAVTPKAAKAVTPKAATPTDAPKKSRITEILESAKPPKKEIEIPSASEIEAEFGPVKFADAVGQPNKSDDILEILNKPPTKKEIETATENYAPGFNEAFGDIEMPGTDRAYDDYMSSIDESLANMMPKTKPVPKSKRPKLVDKEAKTEEWVRKGGKAKPIKVEEIKPTEAPKSSKNYFGNGRKQLSRYVNQEPVAPKTATPNEVTPKTVAPKAPKKPKGQKKNQVVSPAPQTVDEPFDALDLQLAKDYPYSSTARRVYAAQRSKPIVQPTGQMAIEPRVSTTQPKIEESLSDKLLAAFKAEPRKQTGPDFTPRKVIKLPKVEPYSGQKVTGDQADSILFRAFDKGKRPKRSGGDYAISQPMDVDIGTSPRLFPETNIPAGTQKDLQKEIQETIGIPEANIRQGRAINLRSRRKTKGKPGDMEMPTAKSLAAEGEPRTVPTEIPSTETGLSSEQRRTRFYREMFPQARSARQARKMYEESMGRQDILTTIEEFGPIGNPQGPGAPRLPITTTEVQRPVKFEKTLNKRGEVVYKPVKFETETVPAIWTTSSETKPTPLEDVVEMLYPRVDAAKAEAGRQTRKAAKLKSQAEQAARLRNRGVVGDEARKKADEVVRAQKEGKEFQKGNEIELARELSAFYENYMKEGFEQKRFRPALPEKPKTPKKKRNKKK